MYLSRHKYIGAEYKHRNIKGKIELTQGKDNTPIKINFSKVSAIIETAMYWRKANHIHKWFVDNVQRGQDNCASYYVSSKKIKELVNLCKQVLENKDDAESLLPTSSGFFFGGTEYDEYYFTELEDTIKALEPLLDSDDDIYYESSW